MTNHHNKDIIHNSYHPATFRNSQRMQSLPRQEEGSPRPARQSPFSQYPVLIGSFVFKSLN